jgi:hypothetical protein
MSTEENKATTEENEIPVTENPTAENSEAAAAENPVEESITNEEKLMRERDDWKDK